MWGASKDSRDYDVWRRDSGENVPIRTREVGNKGGQEVLWNLAGGGKEGVKSG